MQTIQQPQLSILVRAMIIASTGIASIGTAHASSASECEALVNTQLYNGVVTEATYIKQGKSQKDPMRMFTGAPDMEYDLPSHCLVRGELEKRVRADGKDNVIRFEVRLPDNWGNRFMFQGGGGSDGFLANAIGTTPIAGSTASPALARGYAVTSMNGGHDGVDPTFGLDQQARIDFAYAALGKVTQAAKMVVKQYYSTAAKYSYFMGCSNGGREAMMAAQRYPMEFDGVIAANPGFNLSHAALSEVWDTQNFYKIAPKDNNGKPVLANALSNADLTLLSNAVIEKCDAKDGLKDGIIADYKGCDFDPAELICEKENADTCLSEEKVAVIKTVFDGAHNRRGDRVYSSWPYDSGISAPGWRAWKLGFSQNADKPDALNMTLGAGSFKFYFMTPPQPNYDMTQFDFDDDMHMMHETGALNDAVSTMMNTYASRGGKMMIVQGVSDPVFSADDIERWYLETEQNTAHGDRDAFQQWSRLFMVPGMNHCGGGPALDDLDPLTSMQKWVENDKAPEFLPAKGNAFPGKSMPVCAYPEVAKYDGKGDVNAITSYHCEL